MLSLSPGSSFARDCRHRPLVHADIEDVPGYGACVICPWHHYKISLASGDTLYQDLDRSTCTKGVRPAGHCESDDSRGRGGVSAATGHLVWQSDAPFHPLVNR